MERKPKNQTKSTENGSREICTHRNAYDLTKTHCVETEKLKKIIEFIYKFNKNAFY